VHLNVRLIQKLMIIENVLVLSFAGMTIKRADSLLCLFLHKFNPI
jgi:hypothetical protein